MGAAFIRGRRLLITYSQGCGVYSRAAFIDNYSHGCGLYSRAAFIDNLLSWVRPLFEGGVY